MHRQGQDAPAGDGRGPSNAAVPAMPVIRGHERNPWPSPLAADGKRPVLGWQFANPRNGGPCFVIMRQSALTSWKILERFPLTEQGWEAAWRRFASMADAPIRETLEAIQSRAVSAPGEPARVDPGSAAVQDDRNGQPAAGPSPDEPAIARTDNPIPAAARETARATGARPGETPEQTYLRQIRTAVSVMAWIMGIGAAIAVIVGIIVAVQVSHLNSSLNGGGSGSNCLSQGGTNPYC